MIFWDFRTILKGINAVMQLVCRKIGQGGIVIMGDIKMGGDRN